MRNIKLGRIAGIEVQLHATFPIFVLGLALFTYLARGRDEGLLMLLTLVALFGFVLLHELGHSLVAQRLGVGVRSITLMPLGGIALTESLPRRPADEILIALAGPAVNLLLAGVIALTARGPAGSPAFLDYLLAANLMLALFNLVPAFPMDGGRVLRAAFALRWDYERATQAAVTVGRVFAALFVLAGLLRPGLMMLGLIGVFLFVAGGRELRGVRLDRFLNHRRAADFLDARPWFLADRDTLCGELGPVLDGRPDLAFALVDMEGARYGALSRRQVESALPVLPAQTPVSRLVERSDRALPSSAGAGEALRRLRRAGIPALALLRDGRPVGVVTRAALEAGLAEATRRRGLFGMG